MHATGNFVALQSALLGSPISSLNPFPGGMADLHATFGSDARLALSALGGGDVMVCGVYGHCQ